MSVYKGYTKNQGIATMKCLKKNYEKFTMNLKKGTKELWKYYAERKGMSLTAYITYLIEEDNNK